MFIPRGKAIHENLATSYVLVDALVEDLREGGFSGVVEIALRQATGFVIFDGGKVAAVTEHRGERDYAKTTVAELAAKARAERGRLSVYAYAEPVAKALSSLLHAEPLYTRLSSEFADLQKMVVKFRREGDRHWFIEVRAENNTSLIFIEGGKCVVVTPTLITSEGSPEKQETVNRLALEELIDRCSRSGAIFDVYFRNPDAEPVTADGDVNEDGDAKDVSPAATDDGLPVAPASPAEEPMGAGLTVEHLRAMAAQEEHEAAAPAAAAQDESAATAGELAAVEAPPTASADENETVDIVPDEPVSVPVAPTAEADKEALAEPEIFIAPPPFEQNGLERPERVLPTRELMAMAGTDAQSQQDFRLAEAKRLLGDLARGIEEVTRVVEQRDDFPMHLRAGQLKVADQYPFLDPFGSDFEYIEGEIVFVGKANLHDFVVGISEALRYAVTNAVQVSINPPRLRSEIVRKLKFLYERNREEFDQHGLDVSIEQIAGVQMTG